MTTSRFCFCCCSSSSSSLVSSSSSKTRRWERRSEKKKTTTTTTRRRTGTLFLATATTAGSDDDRDNKTTATTTIGALIQDATTVEQIFKAANESLILEGEETLHFHSQDVHRQKNKSASCNGLKRVAKMSCCGHDVKKKEKNADARKGIIRLIKGASLDGTKTNRKKRASDGIDALRATASVLVAFDYNEDDDIDKVEIRNACEALIQRVEEDAEFFSDGERVVFDWAVRVIENNVCTKSSSSSSSSSSTTRRPDATITVADFPFRYLTPNISDVLKNITVEDLRREVPFKAEKLVTRTGKRVDERRETCFVAESGIGGLAYSGKIMEPTLLNETSLPLVNSIRNAIVEALRNDEEYAGYDINFDCALMNLYPDGSSACAWHTDPEMGTVWDRDSVIVSIGETRRFAFRKLAPGGEKKQKGGEEEQIWVRVHHGDCILMRNDCNDNWEHCVFGKENDSNNAARISLVFKRALSRGGGGKKGHGMKSKGKKKTR